MHFDGTSFVDNSLNNLSITNNGASLSSTESKFGGSSGYFDGSAYLSISNNSVLNFDTGDFTIEGWFRFTTVPGPFTRLFARGDWDSPDMSGHIGLEINSLNSGVFWIGSSMANISSLDLQLNTWQHIAMIRANGIGKLFINGIEKYVGTHNADINNSANLYIATLNGGGLVGTSNVTFTGYIDELRIIKGKALYISNFLPPTAPTPNPIVPDLLLSFEGADGSSSFVDSGPNNFSITSNGNPTISTNQKRIGSSSGYFNGSSELVVLNSSILSFGAGDFTIEAWVYQTSTSGDQFILTGDNNGDFFFGIGAGWNGGNVGIGRRGITWDVTSTEAPPLQTWTHYAATRENGTVRLFKNGQIQNTLQSSENYTITNSSFIGSHNGFLFMNGYIDELRVVKGTALYTTNFNPF